MPSPHSGVLSAGIVLIAVGVVLFMFLWEGYKLFGIAMAILGLTLTIYAFYLAMKSHHVAVQGHFLLHPRTGTRYSPHHALTIQRRLDRIRRAAEEESRPVGPSLPQDGSLHSLPQTPPPWDMEPPPPYETVVKSPSPAT